MTRTTPDYVSTEPEIMPSGLWADSENSTSEISDQSDRLHDDTGNITRAATTIRIYRSGMVDAMSPAVTSSAPSNVAMARGRRRKIFRLGGSIKTSKGIDSKEILKAA